MPLNLWRAAGKICRKKRPGGKVKTKRTSQSRTPHVNFLSWTFIYLLYVMFSFLCIPVPCFLSLKLAVLEDQEEEKKEEEEMKRKNAKRPRKIWSPWINELLKKPVYLEPWSNGSAILTHEALTLFTPWRPLLCVGFSLVRTETWVDKWHCLKRKRDKLYLETIWQIEGRGGPMHKSVNHEVVWI